MELNIAIVDDTLSDIYRLKNFIENWFSMTGNKSGGVVTFRSGEEILKSFEAKMFQIVFMDIIMGAINGVETAKQLRVYDTEILIVFTTTSREYALEAFTVHPFDYLLKPYSKKDVCKVLDEAMLSFSAKDPSVTVRISRTEAKTIPTRLISSVVSQDHKIEITMTDGKLLTAAMTFREIEELFAEDVSFLLCNRGILLNMSQISALDNGVFIMKNGTRYPIRVKDKLKIKAAFAQYLITNMRGTTPHYPAKYVEEE